MPGLTKKKMIEFCKKLDIWMPPIPSREFLTAAIVRWQFKNKEYKLFGNCFGWWSSEESACLYCRHGVECFEAGMGMSKDKYFSRFNGIKNPKITM